MAPTTSILKCAACSALNRVPIERIGNRPLCGKCRNALHVPSAPIDATGANFDRELNEWQELLLLEFWSPTCGYCKMVEPVLRDLARWKAGRLKVMLVNIQSELDLARRYEVMATPALILLKQGRQLDRIDGAPREKLDLVRWVDRHLE